MLGKLKRERIRSATIVEAVVALLILMISFSIGMVIFSRVIGAGVRDLKLRTAGQIQFIADSVSMTADRRNQVVVDGGQRFELTYRDDPRRKGLMIMRIILADTSDNRFSEYVKLMIKDE